MPAPGSRTSGAFAPAPGTRATRAAASQSTSGWCARPPVAVSAISPPLSGSSTPGVPPVCPESSAVNPISTSARRQTNSGAILFTAGEQPDDASNPHGLRRNLRRHRARAARRRGDAAGAAPLRQRPARRQRLRGRHRHRRFRDHRPRLPAARGPARRPKRAQAGRDPGLDLDRDRRAPVLRPRRRRRADRRAPLPRRRRGRRLHRRLGLGRRHDPARATRADHRPLRARDLGRPGARSADRRADPAGDELRDGLGVRRRGAAARSRARDCGSRRSSFPTRPANRPAADLA